MIEDSYDAQELLNMLLSKDVNSRASASSTLLKKGLSGELENKLLQILRDDKDESNNSIAFFILGRYKCQSIIPFLLDKLKNDKHYQHRTLVVYFLGDLEVKEAVPLLLEILQSEKEELSLKQSVIYTLGRIDDLAAIPILKNMYLTKRDLGLHERRNLGEVLDKIAISNGKKNRYDFFQAEEINPRKLELDILLEKLETGDRKKVLEQLKEIEKLPDRDDFFKTDEYKKRHVKDNVKHNRTSAIKQLIGLSSFIKENEETRREVVKSISKFVRDEMYLANIVVEALSKMGKEESIEPLKLALMRDDWVSIEAAKVLGMIGTEASLALIVEVLRNQIETNFERLKVEATKVCGNQLLKETIPVLIEVFADDNDVNLKYEILCSLSKLAKDITDIKILENVLIQELNKEGVDTAILAKAIEILRKIGSKKAANIIFELLHKNSSKIIQLEILSFAVELDETGIIGKKKEIFIEGNEEAKREIEVALDKMGRRSETIELFSDIYVKGKSNFEIEEYNLPLFVHSKDPVDICVIDNRILGFEYAGTMAMYGGRAFEVLSNLIKYDVGKHTIPNELHKYLIEEVKYKRQFEGDPCLSGCYADGMIIYFRCLELNLEISGDSSFPVIFKNIRFEEKPLDVELRLSPEDAFFILSNLCVEGSFAHQFMVVDFLSKEERFRQYDQYIEELVEKRALQHDASRDRRVRFSIEYYYYIRDRIIEKTLQPIDVLRTGGIRTLCLLQNIPSVSKFIDKTIDKMISYHELTVSEKLMFYTLIKSWELESPKKSEFMEKYRHVLQKIEKELRKDFRPLKF